MLKPLFNAIANRSFSCDVAQLNQIVFYLLETCANLKLKPRELEPACYCKKIQKTLMYIYSLSSSSPSIFLHFCLPLLNLIQICLLLIPLHSRTLTLGNRPATPPIQFHAPVSSQHQNYWHCEQSSAIYPVLLAPRLPGLVLPLGLIL